MIGFFKNLFNGIVAFFTGLVGRKKSEENKSSTPSPVEKLAEATSSSAQKLAEATSSSAQKLAEATSSSADKLVEATAKTSSGIQSSLTGLVGGNKSEENKPSTKAAEKPAQATAKKRQRGGYFMELNEDEEMKTANNKQPAQAATAKTSEPAAAKPAKAETAKTPEPAVAPQAAKVELVQTAEGLKAEPAKPAKAPQASANGQKQTETTFAPKYLVPSASNSRRRPGPNMSTFLDMARQVKTPG